MLDTEDLASAAAAIRIRPVEAADAEPLRRFYAALSATSRYRRFMGLGSVDDRDAQRFCGPDHVHAEGFVAITSEPGPDAGSIVGHLCLEPAGDAIELAVAVADGYQGHRVGTRLVGAGMDWAERSGFHRLVASMLMVNSTMVGLLRSLDRPITWSSDAGVVTATVGLRPKGDLEEFDPS